MFVPHGGGGGYVFGEEETGEGNIRASTNGILGVLEPRESIFQLDCGFP